IYTSTENGCLSIVETVKYIKKGEIMMRLNNKVAIITGSASGIGKGIALAMAKEGAHVAIVDVNEEKGQETLKEINNIQEGMLFIKDISKEENVKEDMDAVLDKYSKLDFLVNNSHASRQALFTETTADLFDLSFNTGFYPTVHFMQAAYPALKESKGKVINFASGAGLNGQPTQTSYAAAKEAIRAVSRLAANEWWSEGVNLNMISTIALSECVEHWIESSLNLYEQMIPIFPLCSLGDQQRDIRRTVVFIGSVDAAYITGQTIIVVGGCINLR